jgi:hypothetical protein
MSGIVGSPSSAGSFDDDQLGVLFQCVKAALVHAHGRGVVHLAVSPFSIIWRQEGATPDAALLRIQLSEWGCAASTDCVLRGFLGYEGYAHDDVLLKRKSDQWNPLTKYDIASLVFTMVKLKGNPSSDAPSWAVYFDAARMCEKRRHVANLEINKLEDQTWKDDLQHCWRHEEWLPYDNHSNRKRKHNGS